MRNNPATRGFGIGTAILLWMLPGLAPASAVEPLSALQALRLLPKADAAKLARIEAREGVPAPERWYFLIHEPTAPSGLREFVIVGREIVAAREISQFASRVQTAEILGNQPLRVDSAEVARLALEYAKANGKEVYALNYELSKDGEKAVPIWKVSCLNQRGDSVGQLCITALLGSVVSHDGFLLEPPEIAASKAVAQSAAMSAPTPQPTYQPEASREPPAEATPEWRSNENVNVEASEKERPQSRTAGGGREKPAPRLSSSRQREPAPIREEAPSRPSKSRSASTVNRSKPPPPRRPAPAPSNPVQRFFNRVFQGR